MITILTTLYISNKSKTFKEIPYDIPISDSTFYGLTNRPDWHSIDVGAFSLETPRTYLYTKLRGIDSKVGQIDNQVYIMLFDYGLHSYDFGDEMNNANFDYWTTRINGRLFTIIRKKEGLVIVGAYTSDLPDDHRFNIVCLDCDDPDRTLEIFKTIKFRE